jgi:RhtB (resistance to homoserine/threonine) family protein
MFDSQLLAFTGIVALLTLTPGADTMLVVRSVLSRGWKAGILTTLGISTGLFVHATLSALGLSLILMRSAAVFEIVKLAGAGYLLYLGGSSIWRTLRSRPDRESLIPNDVSANDHPVEGWRSFGDGLITNILNPKVVVFYLAFLPQFIDPGDPVLATSIALTSIHVLLGLIWYSLISLFMGRLKAFFASVKVRKGLEATTGLVLIGFGVRLALERR